MVFLQSSACRRLKAGQRKSDGGSEQEAGTDGAVEQRNIADATFAADKLQQSLDPQPAAGARMKQASLGDLEVIGEGRKVHRQLFHAVDDLFVLELSFGTRQGFAIAVGIDQVVVVVL